MDVAPAPPASATQSQCHAGVRRIGPSRFQAQVFGLPHIITIGVYNSHAKAVAALQYVAGMLTSHGVYVNCTPALEDDKTSEPWGPIRKHVPGVSDATGGAPVDVSGDGAAGVAWHPSTGLLSPAARSPLAARSQGAAPTRTASHARPHLPHHLSSPGGGAAPVASLFQDSDEDSTGAGVGRRVPPRALLRATSSARSPAGDNYAPPPSSRRPRRRRLSEGEGEEGEGEGEEDSDGTSRDSVSLDGGSDDEACSQPRERLFTSKELLMGLIGRPSAPAGEGGGGDVSMGGIVAAPPTHTDADVEEGDIIPQDGLIHEGAPQLHEDVVAAIQLQECTFIYTMGDADEEWEGGEDEDSEEEEEEAGMHPPDSYTEPVGDQRRVPTHVGKPLKGRAAAPVQERRPERAVSVHHVAGHDSPLHFDFVKARQAGADSSGGPSAHEGGDGGSTRKRARSEGTRTVEAAVAPRPWASVCGGRGGRGERQRRRTALTQQDLPVPVEVPQPAELDLDVYAYCTLGIELATQALHVEEELDSLGWWDGAGHAASALSPWGLHDDDDAEEQEDGEDDEEEEEEAETWDFADEDLRNAFALYWTSLLPVLVTHVVDGLVQDGGSTASAGQIKRVTGLLRDAASKHWIEASLHRHKKEYTSGVTRAILAHFLLYRPFARLVLWDGAGQPVHPPLPPAPAPAAAVATTRARGGGTASRAAADGGGAGASVDQPAPPPTRSLDTYVYRRDVVDILPASLCDKLQFHLTRHGISTRLMASKLGIKVPSDLDTWITLTALHVVEPDLGVSPGVEGSAASSAVPLPPSPEGAGPRLTLELFLQIACRVRQLIVDLRNHDFTRVNTSYPPLPWYTVLPATRGPRGGGGGATAGLPSTRTVGLVEVAVSAELATHISQPQPVQAYASLFDLSLVKSRALALKALKLAFRQDEAKFRKLAAQRAREQARLSAQLARGEATGEGGGAGPAPIAAAEGAAVCTDSEAGGQCTTQVQLDPLPASHEAEPHALLVPGIPAPPVSPLMTGDSQAGEAGGLLDEEEGILRRADDMDVEMTVEVDATVGAVLDVAMMELAEKVPPVAHEEGGSGGIGGVSDSEGVLPPAHSGSLSVLPLGVQGAVAAIADEPLHVVGLVPAPPPPGGTPKSTVKVSHKRQPRVAGSGTSRVVAPATVPALTELQRATPLAPGLLAGREEEGEEGTATTLASSLQRRTASRAGAAPEPSATTVEPPVAQGVETRLGRSAVRRHAAPAPAPLPTPLEGGGVAGGQGGTTPAPTPQPTRRSRRGENADDLIGLV